MKILNFLDDIEFKGNKNSIIIKWIIGIFGVIVLGMWSYLNSKNNIVSRLDTIEVLTKTNITNNKNMKKEMDENFHFLEDKINGLYDDGIDAFQKYQQYNNVQLELIIDYSSENKEMLKDMLNMKSINIENDIKGDIEKSKKYDDNHISNLLPKFGKFREIGTDNIIYTVRGAPENYLDTIDTTKYHIIDKRKNSNYKGLFDFEYIEIN